LAIKTYRIMKPYPGAATSCGGVDRRLKSGPRAVAKALADRGVECGDV